MKRILLLFFICCASNISSETVFLEESQVKANIGKAIEYQILPTSASNLQMILNQESNWKQNDKITIHLPNVKETAWFRIQLEHAGKQPETFYLLFSSPVIDRYEVYYQNQGRWLQMVTGEQVFMKDKPLFSHIPTFPFTLTPGEKKTLYVKMESENPLFSFVSVYPSRSFLEYSKTSDIFFAAYFGAGALMFFYSLFLSYSLRYKQFFFYFFYLGSVILVTLFSTGFIQYIEIGTSHEWKNYLFPVSIYLTGIFGLLFTAEFLDLEKHGQTHYRINGAQIGLMLLLMPSILFIDIRTYIDTAVKIVILPILWGIYLSIYSIVKYPKRAENYLFFFALSSILIGAGINVTTIQGWVSPLAVASYSLPFGAAIMIMLLAIALMLRVSDFRKEYEDKQELDTQLKVAKKLQKDLLPKHRSHLKEFPIGFRYLPTSDIGGDFVQFLEDEKGIGIFLCDVSGHGIAAAMIASMTKVSLQLWADELDKPAKAAERIRLSLKENLSSHFLSAVFLYINPEKNIFKIANAGHHPVILLRSDKEPFYINSKGKAITEFIPLTLEEYESELPNEGKFVLYTDGVLEARDPSTNQLFGDERFKTLLMENMDLDPQSLCDRVIGEVFRFSKYKRADDDITIFAIDLKKK
ncbi:stage II sporulation protein E [Leptospira ryugenii]|uniref:Stage II sporulation protein E n=1 Tax=Leptospira ryugenii TaxID=1917863 RepID=A0A2P2DZ66_9LEPT|nr:SpoIIE family protein phosphatase [Leptospira ryugenii]GBF49905.1 stage II sporulation protein E [Leptospira ryugenii]